MSLDAITCFWAEAKSSHAFENRVSRLTCQSLAEFPTAVSFEQVSKWVGLNKQKNQNKEWWDKSGKR